jgi:hypothetical protein
MARRRIASIFSSKITPSDAVDTQAVPLPQLVDESRDILFTLSTVFPFILFTDKVVIRKNHVDVVRGIFFGSASTTRIEIADIKQVTTVYNPFFAALEIIPQGPLEHIFRISFLWRGNAMKAKRLISGLMESHQKKVDLSAYSGAELLNALEQIGKTRG